MSEKMHNVGRKHSLDTPSDLAIQERILPDPRILPEGEWLQPHMPWTTTDATFVSKKGYPTEFPVQSSQLKDCEMLQRAGLGMTNHPTLRPQTSPKTIVPCLLGLDPLFKF